LALLAEPIDREPQQALLLIREMIDAHAGRTAEAQELRGLESDLATQGKDERMHRSLKAEAMQEVRDDLEGWQAAFDVFRLVYNTQRPYQALDYAVPAQRYQINPRPWTGRLIEPEYGPDDLERRVQQNGWFSFKGHALKVSKAFASLRIALRPTADDGVWDVIFISQRI
jgi:hypothetical protein